MIPADIALAMLINRTTAAYNAGAPTYISYTEHTHITVQTLHRTQDIDRAVVVRNADNFAIMHDLPQGAERTGDAFPIIPYFDPLSAFGFGYYANLKLVTITLDRKEPFVLPIPAADPTVDVVVPYNSFWIARYASDSTNNAVHLQIDPTSRVSSDSFYPSDVIVDQQTQLPSHIEMRTGSSDMVIDLDYKLIGGHWTIVHGVFSSTEHVAVLTFKVVADITYSNIAFPTTAPDPRLAGPPTPAPSATP
jgi:hypothetical protein